MALADTTGEKMHCGFQPLPAHWPQMERKEWMVPHSCQNHLVPGTFPSLPTSAHISLLLPPFDKTKKRLFGLQFGLKTIWHWQVSPPSVFLEFQLIAGFFTSHFKCLCSFWVVFWDCHLVTGFVLQSSTLFWFRAAIWEMASCVSYDRPC